MSNQLNSPHSVHARELEPLISAYQDKEVTPAEASRVEYFLENCQECRRILTDYRQITTGLSEYLKNIVEPKTPETVKIASLKPEQPRRSPEPAFAGVITQAGRTGLVFGLAAAVILFLAVGFLVLVNLPERQAQTVVGTGQINETISPEPTATPPLPTATPTLEPSPTIVPVTTSEQPAIQPTPTPMTPPPVTPQTTAPVRTTVATTRPSIVTTNSSLTTAPTSAATTLALVTTTSTTPAPTGTTTVTTPPLITATPTKTTVTPLPTTADSSVTPVPNGTPTPSPSPSTILSAGWVAYIDREDGEIYLTHSDGTGKMQLSWNSLESKVQWRQLAWSNDSKWLAAVGLTRDNGKFGIYQFRIDDPPKQQPALNNLIAEGANPVWSPTSYYMTYLAGPVREESGLLYGQPAVIDLKKRTNIILSKEYSGLTPQWFEDEKRLLVGQTRVMSREGQNFGELNIFENTCAAASLSPKGNKLAVLELAAGGGFRPMVYDLNQNSYGRLKPLMTGKSLLPGNLGRGFDCGAYRIQWNQDSVGFYFYMTEGGQPRTCWVSSASGYSQCLKNVVTPAFSYDASYFVDFNPTTGQIYSSIFGDKPQNPRTIGLTRYGAVWQPRL
jgi:hypothetical protein